MDICEQCGATALDADGRCRICGWQAALEADDAAVSSPSLAATRAVETPDAASPASRAGAPRASSFNHTVDLPMARATPTGQPPSRITRVPGSEPTPGARFCGVCGARIASGEAFCGQCGTPIAQATGEYATAYSPNAGAPSRYPVGAGGPWGESGSDDLTEAYMPAPFGASRPGLAGTSYAYDSPSYPPAASGPAPASIESARRTRIAIGLLCVAGGLASAGGAIIVALIH